MCIRTCVCKNETYIISVFVICIREYIKVYTSIHCSSDTQCAMTSVKMKQSSFVLVCFAHFLMVSLAAGNNTTLSTGMGECM